MNTPSTILFRTLTPSRLGYDEYRRRYHLLRQIAAFHADGEFDLRVTHDPVTHERAGCAVVVPSEIVAAWVRRDFGLTVRGEPAPWVSL